MTPPLSAVELRELIPYGILGLGALAVLLGSLVRGRKVHSMILAIFASAFAVTALVSFAFYSPPPSPLPGLFFRDTLGLGFAAVLLSLTALALPALAAAGRSLMTEGPGVTAALTLLSACGGCVMAFANHLVVFFVGLELLSLPVYVLTGLGKEEKSSAEAAYKYFLLGAVASALFLFGTAFLWGGTGTLLLSEMGRGLQPEMPAALGVIGGALVLAGVAFKLGLVPFHSWVPDVYEGAPSPIVAWMTGAVKAGALVLAVRAVGSAFPSPFSRGADALGLLCAASMIWGSTAALAHKSVKRILAYSSIAHSGYMAICFVCISGAGTGEVAGTLVFYALTYGLAALGAFLVVSTQEAEGRTNVSDFAGLWRRRPALAVAMAVFLLSLAGLPPLSGFIAKFNVFALAIREGFPVLALIGVLTSVVSLAYYLRILAEVYMGDSRDVRATELSGAVSVVLAVAATALVALGILPGNLLSILH